MVKEGVNRWIDNIFIIKFWCVRKFGLEEKMIDKNFGILEDFDYVEQIEIQLFKNVNKVFIKIFFFFFGVYFEGNFVCLKIFCNKVCDESFI